MIGAVAARTAGPTWHPLAIALLLPLLASWLWRRSTVLEESVTVVRDLGVHLETRFVSGSLESRFLDMQKIQDVVLNEGISMHRIVFYLAFLVKGHDKMVVVFPHLATETC